MRLFTLRHRLLIPRWPLLCPSRNIKTTGKSNKKTKTTSELGSKITTSLKDVDLPTGWRQKLLSLGPDLAFALASLADNGQISNSQFLKARKGLLSFSDAKWRELAPSFNLPIDIDNMASTIHAKGLFKTFSIPPVLLPPSFHEATAEAAWHIQDVYQDRVNQGMEEARVRFFDAVSST
jgi:hypothetical protein